ncbi:MAG: Protein yif1b [Marteilia pararefringens]
MTLPSLVGRPNDQGGQNFWKSQDESEALGGDKRQATECSNVERNLDSSAKDNLISSKIGNEMIFSSSMIQTSSWVSNIYLYALNLASFYGSFMKDKVEKSVKYKAWNIGTNQGLKMYLSIDNNYVFSKLFTLIYPFKNNLYVTKKANRTIPKFDHNLPDLYIPTMSFITFLLLAAIIRGIKNQFSTEFFPRFILKNLMIFVGEYLILSYFLTLFQSILPFDYLDFLCLLGYRYFYLICCVIIKILFARFLSFICTTYFALTFGYFLVKSLKHMMFGEESLSKVISARTQMPLYVYFSILLMQPIIFWLILGYIVGIM